MRKFTVIISGLLVVLHTYGSPLETSVTELPADELKPFLERYCMDCHGERKQKGQVRFDDISFSITNDDTAQHWQDVLDQLNGGDMPPEDEEQPETQELISVLGQLTDHLQVARKRLTAVGGEAPMRRLNRREYVATIKSLFGFEPDYYAIPEDGESESFDTVGSDHLFSSQHLDKYLMLGREIAKGALEINTRPHREIQVKRTEAEQSLNDKLREKVEAADKKKAIKDTGGSWQEMGFKDEGAMQILFRQWNSRVEKPRRYLQYPMVEEGVYISDVVNKASANLNVDLRGEYVIRVRGGAYDPRGDLDDIRRIIKVQGREGALGTLKVQGTTTNPQIMEMRKRLPLGQTRLSVSVQENTESRSISKISGKTDRTDPRAAVWIDWIELEGPYYPEKRPLFEDILYPDRETGSGKPICTDEANIREFFRSFAYHAFRRLEPGEPYLDALMAYYEKQNQAGLKQKSAIVEVMAVILSSPRFLYIQKEKGQDWLSKRELATRLSYFLWSSPPDDELYAANLYDKTEYERQVNRMLDDERADAFKKGFIEQWTEFDRYDAVSIDMRHHYRFNTGLRYDAKQEVREFFGALIEENLPADNLIDSDFLMINGALATHYDLPYEVPENGETDEFVRVKLPAGSPRGGLLTQTAFLVAGSNGERSSPVIRGSLIMEKILNNTPAPPPPNVPELGTNSDEPLSNRELIMLHQSEPTCASCHQKIDPIGFGLENFDTVGRWRDKEIVSKKKQVEIDPSGHLLDKASFNDIHSFKKALLGSRDTLAEQLVESFFSYGLGRTMEFSDQEAIDAVVAKTKKDNYRMRDLIVEVALSETFRSK